MKFYLTVPVTNNFDVESYNRAFNRSRGRNPLFNSTVVDALQTQAGSTQSPFRVIATSGNGQIGGVQLGEEDRIRKLMVADNQPQQYLVLECQGQIANDGKVQIDAIEQAQLYVNKQVTIAGGTPGAAREYKVDLIDLPKAYKKYSFVAEYANALVAGSNHQGRALAQIKSDILDVMSSEQEFNTVLNKVRFHEPHLTHFNNDGSYNAEINKVFARNPIQKLINSIVKTVARWFGYDNTDPKADTLSTIKFKAPTLVEPKAQSAGNNNNNSSSDTVSNAVSYAWKKTADFRQQASSLWNLGSSAFSFVANGINGALQEEQKKLAEQQEENATIIPTGDGTYRI
ncbi:MAG: hypothetical protein Tsb005_19880 [Gammaproteobacteria bacterium]